MQVALTELGQVARGKIIGCQNLSAEILHLLLIHQTTRPSTNVSAVIDTLRVLLYFVEVRYCTRKIVVVLFRCVRS